MTQSADNSPDDGLHSDPAIKGALAKIAAERGWSAELMRRVAELRVPVCGELLISLENQQFATDGF